MLQIWEFILNILIFAIIDKHRKKFLIVPKVYIMPKWNIASVANLASSVKSGKTMFRSEERTGTNFGWLGIGRKQELSAASCSRDAPSCKSRIRHINRASRQPAECSRVRNAFELYTVLRQHECDTRDAT